MKKIVEIHTDGSSLGNPGPGGIGIVMQSGSKKKEISEGYRLTTNNRMELLAAIKALEAMKSDKYKIVLRTDSKYLADAVEKGWARKWEANGWKRNKKDKALNPDLWERLLDLLDEYDVDFRWVKAHAGNELNERCDFLAKQAAESENLKIDVEYEKSINNS